MWCDSPWWAGTGLTLTVFGAGLCWTGMRQTWKQTGGGITLTFSPVKAAKAISAFVRHPIATVGWSLTPLLGDFLALLFIHLPERLPNDDKGTSSEQAHVHKKPAMPDGPIGAQTAWLNDHLQRLEETVRDLDSRASHADQVLRGVVAQQKEDLDHRILDAAVSGLPRQATGLFLVTLGALIAAVPSLCPLVQI